MPSSSLPPDDEEETRVGSTPRELVPRATTARDRPYLIVLAGESVGQLYKIEDHETLIGRTSNAKIRLNDDGISRRHARLIHRGTQVTIEDLKSANGTMVNEVPIEGQCELKDGDKIRIGSTTVLRFSYHDDLEESFQQHMYEAALRDGLTKAFNKKYFLDRLESELAYARRHRAHLSLVMFDVDHFKRVNDSLGHLGGDYVLARIAKITQAAVRTEDVFARYGGEEFGIVCRAVELAKAGIFAERLRGTIEAAAFEYEGEKLQITVSIGVAAFPVTTAESVTQLIQAADDALYEAKRSGRNRVILQEASGPIPGPPPSLRPKAS